nr:uncharacterized protein LOC109175791 [Ipomoea trifida]
MLRVQKANQRRSCTSKLLTSTESLLPISVSRGIYSTGMKRMGGAHGQGHDEPFYFHAKNTYNLDRMKHQKLKITLGVLSTFNIGVAIPVWDVIFQ